MTSCEGLERADHAAFQRAVALLMPAGIGAGLAGFESFGARIAVRADEACSAEDIRRALPIGSRLQDIQNPDVTFHLTGPPGTAAGLFELRLESALLQSSPFVADLLQRLESELHFQVALHARTALFVHAGVVGWEGRAILVPGRSRSGKTSLVAALARAGAEYYSDEYAVVDTRGRVHPYPKPLSIRGTGDVATNIGFDDLGFRVGAAPLRAALIVSTRHEPGARFRPRAAGRGRGLLHLVDNTVVVRARPRFALECLEPVARDAAVLEGIRGDSDEAAADLIRWCADNFPKQEPSRLRANGRRFGKTR